jgi:hypothetical protein
MDDEIVKATVKRERKVNTFAELSHANHVLLENTAERREGWFYECMTAILMSAFKFEAYLNHLGEILFPYWNQMEQLSHKKKLNIICSHLGIENDNGKRPYQTLENLFGFRNKIAHGKSEYLDPPDSVEVGNIEEIRRKMPLTKWEELCTIKFAKQTYEDTETIIEQLHTKAGLDITDLRRSGHYYEIKDEQKIK